VPDKGRSNVKQFTLIGRPGYVFRVASTFLWGGFIPCVAGVSVCGGFRTLARVADVVEVL
jgi:hypothetical protein